MRSIIFVSRQVVGGLDRARVQELRARGRRGRLAARRASCCLEQVLGRARLAERRAARRRQQPARRRSPPSGVDLHRGRLDRARPSRPSPGRGAWVRERQPVLAQHVELDEARRRSSARRAPRRGIAPRARAIDARRVTGPPAGLEAARVSAGTPPTSTTAAEVDVSERWIVCAHGTIDVDHERAHALEEARRVDVELAASAWMISGAIAAANGATPGSLLDRRGPAAIGSGGVEPAQRRPVEGRDRGGRRRAAAPRGPHLGRGRIALK